MQARIPGLIRVGKFIFGIPDHGLPARAEVCRAGLHVPVPQANIGRTDRQGEPFLGFAQSLFGSLALGDVALDTGTTCDFAFGIRASLSISVVALGRANSPATRLLFLVTVFAF